jgi:hypothetical protein
MELLWPQKIMMELHMNVWNDILSIRKQVHKKDCLDEHNLQLWDGSSLMLKKQTRSSFPCSQIGASNLKMYFGIERGFIVAIPPTEDQDSQK